MNSANTAVDFWKPLGNFEDMCGLDQPNAHVSEIIFILPMSPRYVTQIFAQVFFDTSTEQRIQGSLRYFFSVLSLVGRQNNLHHFLNLDADIEMPCLLVCVASLIVMPGIYFKLLVYANLIQYGLTSLLLSCCLPHIYKLLINFPGLAAVYQIPTKTNQ